MPRSDASAAVRSRAARRDQPQSPAQTSPSRGLLDVLASDTTRDELRKALPPGLDLERFLRVTRTAVLLDPYLMGCEVKSFIAAVHRAAQLGLEPGSGLCYLQRYGKKCTFVLGYRGIIELAGRTGKLLGPPKAVTVYENDEFEYEQGLDERLKHKPTLGDPGDIKCFYGIAKFADGGHFWIVVPVWLINEHRGRSESWKSFQDGRSKDSPWHSDYAAMGRKTVIRIMEPYLPFTPEVHEAIQADETYQDDIGDAVHRTDEPIPTTATPVDDTVPDPDPEPEAPADPEPQDPEPEAPADPEPATEPGQGTLAEIVDDNTCETCGAVLGRGEAHEEGCPEAPE